MSDQQSQKSKILSKPHKKKFKRYDPLIWILDPDPVVAPHLLNNKYLNRSITAGIQVLLCARFWFAGIRNKKAFNYWFSEEKADTTMQQLFGGFDFTPGTALRFTQFTHRTTKWARKCKEHMKFVEDFVWNGVCEWVDRTGHPHPDYDFAEFLCCTKPASEQMPSAHLKKIVPEWKNLPPRLRRNDVYGAFKQFYAEKIGDPWMAYKNDKVDIPEFLIKNDFA